MKQTKAAMHYLSTFLVLSLLLTIASTDYHVGLTRSNDAREKVKIQIYYEVLCPYSKKFFINDLSPVFIRLGHYVDLETYPYGNAYSVYHGDGSVSIICQHGERECYGNKLHACALAILRSTTAVTYNICLMSKGKYGSDDSAADSCGSELWVDPEPIKSCARGTKGNNLLRRQGEITDRVGISYVPFVVINGKVNKRGFLKVVCESIEYPPEVCRSALGWK